MNIQLLPPSSSQLASQPGRAIAKVSFNPEDKALAQAGSMLAMSGNLSVSTTLRNGRTVSRPQRWRGGGATPKTLFLNQFYATAPGHVLLAAPLPGDLAVHTLTRQGLIASSLAYLASTTAVELNLDSQTLPHCLTDQVMAPKGQFWLTFAGQGAVILGALGGLYTVTVAQAYRVAPHHVVAFEAGLEVTLLPASSSQFRTWLGDDQRVCHFQGQGKVYCQTHSGSAWCR
ncbi:MAG: TIGR00266 family protein [Cyanobacteria bacterium P01_G01_bin.54]